MTLQKRIKWELDSKRIFPSSDNNQSSNVRPFSIDMSPEGKVALRPWMEYVFSSLVDGKIFRLIGVFDFIEEKIKSVKLQLWNNEQEYEFPDHPSFMELFQLVREIEIKKNKFYVESEAENFVDKLLKKSYAAAMQ
jgi:hypothetical protein